VAVLNREMYSLSEAAGLLSTPEAPLHATTLKRWLEGDVRNGKKYSPVLRREPTGRDAVTWAEFVEAGLLKEYRRRDVPLQRLRPMIDAMRSEFDIEYPLAHFRPLIDPASREVVLTLQTELGLDKKLFLVVRKGGMQSKLEFSEPVEAYLEKVDFDELAIAERFRPFGKQSPLVIDPQQSFGIPTVRGIRTEVLVEQFQAGEPIDRIADDFDLSRADVEEALRWEMRAA
jgi:uncharacterized protein (DUF433 family)